MNGQVVWSELFFSAAGRSSRSPAVIAAATLLALAVFYEAVAVIEAMKMQNIIRAERDGTVKAVNAQSGDSVAADEVLVEFA